jgi:SAM-dependent methyltransferase
VSVVVYPADLFAATHQGTEGDVAFYRRHCAGARSVLELGCGYGRVLRELATVVPDAHGLDLDDALLGMAARSGAHVHRGDMTSFDLARTFDRIVIPHSGIYCLTDEASVRRCLLAVRTHLAPSGSLAFDAYVADAFHARSPGQSWDDDDEVELDPVRARGQQWRLFERSHWDRATQRIDVEYRYVGEDGTEIEASIQHRYLLRWQVEALLVATGFDAIVVDGGFAGEPWREDGAAMVVVARA